MLVELMNNPFPELGCVLLQQTLIIILIPIISLKLPLYKGEET